MMDRRDLALAQAKGKILDMGCGDALFLWNGQPPSHVICADIDVYKHSQVQAEASFLPFRDNSFDTVLLLEILEHVDDVEAVVKEALRVAKKVVIISYPHETREDYIKRNDEPKEAIRKSIEFEKQHGLVKPYLELSDKTHTHWKDENRIREDIETIRKFGCLEFSLNYGLYDGWGFVCKKADDSRPKGWGGGQRI